MASAGTANMIDDTRKRVLWIGAIPPNFDDFKQEFERRELSLEGHDGINVRDVFATTRGIILKYNPKKPGALKKHIQDFCSAAIDHGVMIYIIAEDSIAQKRVEELLIETQFNKDYVSRKTDPHAYDVANKIAHHEPGPGLNPSLDGIEALDDTAQFFLKRAFWDCRSIKIKSMGDGLSADAYSVQAVFDNSLAGPRPLPFFAKIDDVEKIKEELDHYKQYVFHFIPFNLRPNIDSYRCIQGHKKGILVGNFVEQSESLWDALRRGNTPTIIYSLFDNALRSWRMQAGRQEDNLWKRIGDVKVFDPSRVSSARLDCARANGATREPHELCDLLARLPKQEYLDGPIHGDLHAKNVMVRGSDTILIDFALTRSGPLVADPASLEVGLAFEVTDEHDDDSGWKELMDTLYSTECLGKPLPLAREPRPREWLWNAVRQIRLFALSEKTSDCEYSSVVAMYLLRKSMYPRKPDESDSIDFRRAYAYVLAEKIIVDVAKKLGV